MRKVFANCYNNVMTDASISGKTMPFSTMTDSIATHLATKSNRLSTFHPL